MSFRCRAPRHRAHRAGFTLIEMVVVCTIIGLCTAIAVRGVRGLVDSVAVEAAARDAAAALSLGRLTALRHGGAEVRLDSGTMTIRAASGEVRVRRIADAHGVSMRATQAVVRYAPTGLATGLSNGSIILTRGARADTVFISRLGRVRRTR